LGIYIDYEISVERMAIARKRLYLCPDLVSPFEKSGEVVLRVNHA
jgi:hypothetical protein